MSIKNEMEAALLELADQQEEKPPKGWKTCPEWAEETGLSLSHTRKKLGDLVKAGIFEVRKLRRKGTCGVAPRPFYGPAVKK